MSETATTLAKIRQAQQNLTYWRRQKILRTDHVARVEAGARVLLWEQQFRAHQDRLNTLISAAPDPAAPGNPPVIDCGSGHPYGTCPRCGLPHGHVVMMAGHTTI